MNDVKICLATKARSDRDLRKQSGKKYINTSSPEYQTLKAKQIPQCEQQYDG